MTTALESPKTISVRWWAFALLALLLVGVAACGDPAPPDPVVRAFDAAADRLYPVAVEDSLLATEQQQPTAERIAAWARRFAAADSVVYLFGLEPGGYVTEGRLVADHRQDCVSLLYRTTELARARDSRDAVAWALKTRFAGATPDSVVAPDGRVDYDHPAHLDYSLDMIRSGWWGRDVTGKLSGAVADTAGSSRYAPESFRYIPQAALRDAELADGDIVWFVLDPGTPAGRMLRQDYGLVIGHIGIVVREDGRAQLVHAARSDLPGEYTGGTVVMVPLTEYLRRVEKFAGVVVTRF